MTKVIFMQIGKKKPQDRRRTSFLNKVTVSTATLIPRLQLNLVAREDIAKGEVIVYCSFDEVRHERTWRTIQVDYNRHVKNELLDYVDHSCDPNAVFITEDLTLVSLKSINAGECITFFYPGSEVELAHDFICTCGSSNCLGHLKGGFYLTSEQMRWAIDNGYCTSFIKEQFIRFLGFSD
jgi:hypothetical protein